jgi:hypothetical protein
MLKQLAPSRAFKRSLWAVMIVPNTARLNQVGKGTTQESELSLADSESGFRSGWSGWQGQPRALFYFILLKFQQIYTHTVQHL